VYKYHSIEQFRNCIKEVQFLFKDQPKLPTLTFTGSVKLHGTNAGVELPANIPQSRNQVLAEGNDSYGFYTFHKERKEIFQQIYDSLGLDLPVVIYGEWAGKGIQQGVAISKLDRAFYIFGIKVITGEDSHYWISGNFFLNFPDNNIYDLHLIKNYEIDVDFNHPELSVPELQELTLEVEQECPVSKVFEVSGIGEGIVWEHITEDGQMLSFKVKGEKHSSSKVKVLANVDIEKVNSIAEFVDTVLTESRLQQAWNELNQPTIKELGLFLKWINNDIVKEESDTLVASNLTIKDVGSALSKQAKQWFLSKQN
jgi:hypothetical protein